MPTRIDRSVLAGLALAAVLAASGCGGGRATPSTATAPAAPSTEVASAGESALPSEAPTTAGPSVGSLYVRLWFINPSLGPDNFFFSAIAVSNGKLYYKPDLTPTSPAPIYVAPVSAAITASGISTIVAVAQKDGLLGATHDFQCPHAAGAPMMSGTGTTYLEIVVDGVSHDLSGTCQYEEDPGTGAPVSGTYGAFVDFTDHLRNMSGWLGSDLGAPAPWTPTSVVVAAAAPDAAWWGPSVDPGDTTTWLVGTFASFGNLRDPAGSPCGVLTGAALTNQLPSIKAGHEGTIFVDSAGVQRVLALHVLMPDESTDTACK